MKLLLILILFSSCNLSDCQDEKACSYYKEKIQIVTKSINKERIDVGRVNNAIVFLEKITTINSTSDGNYLGRFNPTKADLKKWTEWYDDDKHLLFWDNIKKTVKVKKDNRSE